jgi:L-lysine 2,3-aminomutase
MDDTVMMAKKKVKEALGWIEENESITEVLITEATR